MGDTGVIGRRDSKIGDVASESWAMRREVAFSQTRREVPKKVREGG